MGIDVFMEWKGMTESEREAQRTLDARGAQGWLRESLHNGDLFTRYLFREAFQAKRWDGTGEQPDGDLFYLRSNVGIAYIAADVLRQRLPTALKMVSEEWFIAGSMEVNESYLQGIRDFVALAERKEMETDLPVIIIVAP